MNNRIRIRHFYKSSERIEFKMDGYGRKVVIPKAKLVATIATKENEDGTISVGISRVHKEDVPKKNIGRSIAISRLMSLIDDIDSPTLTYPVECIDTDCSEDMSLALVMTKDELLKMIRENPFAESGCRYGR